MTLLLADPRVAAVPVHDAGEPLVSLPFAGTATGAGRLVRQSVAERLLAAADALPTGYRFLLSEGYRAAADQQAIVTAYARRLRALHPAAPETEIARLGSRYVAPLAVAPHVAGAAVDLTLADEGGRELPMGCPLDATPEESGGACYLDAPHLDAQARAHRTVLRTALEDAGLVNYPTEWWHWSFGDRYWAVVTGAPEALYGPVAGSLGGAA